MSYVSQTIGMRVHIFDVEHGEYSAIETPTGHLLLIGAGHNPTTNWRPSAWVQKRNQPPACMVLTNLDRDHLSDLPNFEPDGADLRRLSHGGKLPGFKVGNSWCFRLRDIDAVIEGQYVEESRAG